MHFDALNRWVCFEFFATIPSKECLRFQVFYLALLRAYRVFSFDLMLSICCSLYGLAVSQWASRKVISRWCNFSLLDVSNGRQLMLSDSCDCRPWYVIFEGIGLCLSFDLKGSYFFCFNRIYVFVVGK